jgi:ABC-type transport system involved in multi-copper enzyme maturation permease subunit
MTWLTWRQFRAQAITAVAALAAFAIVLGATGPHLARMYAASGITGCSANCGHLASDFLGLVTGIDTVVYTLGIAAVILAPALIGIFWGAPLIAREIETGTFRLAWTQTITRARWLVSKLAVPGLAAMAVTEGLSLMYSWWAAPITEAARLTPGANFPVGMGPFSLLAFDAHGIVPLGYAAFAFTLGVTTGTFVRRPLPAMAITLAVFAAVQVAMPLGIRPHLFSPVHSTVSVAQRFSGVQSVSGDKFALTPDYIFGQPGAWLLASHAVNAAGQPASVMPAACINPASGDSLSCLASHGIEVAVTYQPTSRYWAFQWTETAIFLALALALAGLCFWRLSRRLS